MELQHTKGAWAVASNQVKDEYQYSVLCDGSKLICNVLRRNYPEAKQDEEPLALANAVLMAAAPSMLKSLQAAQKVIELQILKTPTGEERNKLCDLNIEIQTLIHNATNI